MRGGEGAFFDLFAHFFRFELFDGEQRESQLILFAEGLRHLPQEPFADADALVRGQVGVGVAQMLLNPFGQLAAFVGARVALVGENHDAVIRFAANAATYALGRVTHRVEREEIVLPDEKLLPVKEEGEKKEWDEHTERVG